MATRKVTLKVNVACKQCRDKLLKQIHAVPGVKKVEISSECCPLFIISGDFNVDNILKATEKKRKCITVESVEEIPAPPPPPPPKEDKPKEEPKPEPPKAPEKPPKVEEPAPENSICVVTADMKKGLWPKLPKHLPPGTSLVIMVENLFLCPQGHNHGHSHDCDSCC